MIIVRYESAGDNGVEWVYNAADIDNSQIVWARELDPTEDGELVSYFKDRRVWLLSVNRGSTRLIPYPSSSNL